MTCTPDHRFYVVEYGWKTAQELTVGDDCLSFDGSQIAFVQRDAFKERRLVYNIEIEGAHCYFAGRNGGVLVHNVCSSCHSVDCPGPNNSSSLYRLLFTGDWYACDNLYKNSMNAAGEELLSDVENARNAIDLVSYVDPTPLSDCLVAGTYYIEGNDREAKIALANAAIGPVGDLRKFVRKPNSLLKNGRKLDARVEFNTNIKSVKNELGCLNGNCFVKGTQVLIDETSVSTDTYNETDKYYTLNINKTATLCIVVFCASYTAVILHSSRDVKSKVGLLEVGTRQSRTSENSNVNVNHLPLCFDRHNNRQSRLWGVSVCLLALTFVSFCLGLCTDNASNAVPRLAQVNSENVQRRYTTKNIEDVRIGERTLGVNPQGRVESELDETIFQTVPHYGYFLSFVKSNGSHCDVELLRSEDWLDNADVQFRRKSNGVVVDEIDLIADCMSFGDVANTNDYELEVWLNLPEMGVVGWATLKKIDANVEICSGPGNIVTGVFTHTADNVLELNVEDCTEKIGCTVNHPFWSVDRHEFTPAGELREGEQLLLYNGETKRVVQKLPRPGPQVVYNLEVYGEHVYHVANNPILVHNNCDYVNYYRTMAKQDYEKLVSEGYLPASKNETFISPNIDYVKRYDGITVKFKIHKDILEQLVAKGVYSKGNRYVANKFGLTREVFHGWKGEYAYFKLERGIINIGLGTYGKDNIISALDIFNEGLRTQNIIFNRIKRKK